MYVNTSEPCEQVISNTLQNSASLCQEGYDRHNFNYAQVKHECIANIGLIT